MKETENNTNKWKDRPWYWITRIDIVTINILSMAIYRFNAIPVKIPKAFFIELELKILKFIWKHQTFQITKTILRKIKVRSIALSIHLYHKSTVIKISCCGTTGSIGSLQHWDAGLISSPVQWVKDPALLLLWYRAQMQLRFGSGLIPGLRTCNSRWGQKRNKNK